jgi:hypothetical protein
MLVGRQLVEFRKHLDPTLIQMRALIAEHPDESQNVRAMQEYAKAVTKYYVELCTSDEALSFPAEMENFVNLFSSIAGDRFQPAIVDIMAVRAGEQGGKKILMCLNGQQTSQLWSWIYAPLENIASVPVVLLDVFFKLSPETLQAVSKLLQGQSNHLKPTELSEPARVADLLREFRRKLPKKEGARLADYPFALVVALQEGIEAFKGKKVTDLKELPFRQLLSNRGNPLSTGNSARIKQVQCFGSSYYPLLDVDDWELSAALRETAEAYPPMTQYLTQYRVFMKDCLGWNRVFACSPYNFMAKSLLFRVVALLAFLVQKADLSVNDFDACVAGMGSLLVRTQAVVLGHGQLHEIGDPLADCLLKWVVKGGDPELLQSEPEGGLRAKKKVVRKALDDDAYAMDHDVGEVPFFNKEHLLNQNVLEALRNLVKCMKWKKMMQAALTFSLLYSGESKENYMVFVAREQQAADEADDPSILELERGTIASVLLDMALKSGATRVGAGEVGDEEEEAAEADGQPPVEYYSHCYRVCVKDVEALNKDLHDFVKLQFPLTKDVIGKRTSKG